MYHYREQIEHFISRHKWTMLGMCVSVSVVWYVMPEAIGKIQIFTLSSLVLFGMWLAYAIAVKSSFMNNRFMKYFGGISMEMYLAQMVVFRMIEKAGLLYVFGSGWISFAIVCVAEVMLLTMGIEIYKKAELFCRKIFSKGFVKTKNAFS